MPLVGVLWFADDAGQCNVNIMFGNLYFQMTMNVKTKATAAGVMSTVRIPTAPLCVNPAIQDTWPMQTMMAVKVICNHTLCIRWGIISTVFSYPYLYRV